MLSDRPLTLRPGPCNETPEDAPGREPPEAKARPAVRLRDPGPGLAFLGGFLIYHEGGGQGQCLNTETELCPSPPSPAPRHCPAPWPHRSQTEGGAGVSALAPDPLCPRSVAPWGVWAAIWAPRFCC